MPVVDHLLAASCLQPGLVSNSEADRLIRHNVTALHQINSNIKMPSKLLKLGKSRSACARSLVMLIRSFEVIHIYLMMVLKDHQFSSGN